MIPNVVRGSKMTGLLLYLVGPGRAEEHSDPHLVAGDGPVMAWFDDEQLNRDAAVGIAHHLDKPRKAFDVDVDQGHVWHCSLSLRADEGLIGDERWRAIADDFVSLMGFDGQDGSRAPCRWAAIHHGVSKNGNDHVHVVVNVVREDGTKANTHKDFSRAQSACRELERRHGLEQLESAPQQRSTRGYRRGELEIASRRAARARSDDRSLSTADLARTELARRVRGCATASADEAEFVRRMRRAGLLVRPRFASGRDDVVTGFSVASRPPQGQRPVFYGGGRLGHDLSLPRLRQEWPDTPDHASAAAREWTAARRNRRPAHPGRELHETDPELWQTLGHDLERLRSELSSVPVHDHDTWAQVARQASGAFAAWSIRTESIPGPLAAASDALSVAAQTKRPPLRPQRPLTSVAGAALLLAAATRGGRGVTAELVMLRQLTLLATSVLDMHRAVGEARQAARIEHVLRDQLTRVSQQLHTTQLREHHPQAVAAARIAGLGQAPPSTRSTPASPVPSSLRPHRPRVTERDGPGR